MTVVRGSNGFSCWRTAAAPKRRREGERRTAFARDNSAPRKGGVVKLAPAPWPMMQGAGVTEDCKLTLPIRHDALPGACPRETRGWRRGRRHCDGAHDRRSQPRARPRVVADARVGPAAGGRSRRRARRRLHREFQHPGRRDGRGGADVRTAIAEPLARLLEALEAGRVPGRRFVLDEAARLAAAALQLAEAAAEDERAAGARARESEARLTRASPVATPFAVLEALGAAARGDLTLRLSRRGVDEPAAERYDSRSN